jgi:dihydroxyacetone kinase-like protein
VTVVDVRDAVVDGPRLCDALLRWCDALQAAAPELNALDAQLGDGDLGNTLAKCAENVRQSCAGGARPLGPALKACAMDCARASGSSFGTLLSVGFLAAAKAVGERTALDRDALVDTLRQAHAALSSRGGAANGDKTMLDSLQAVADALRDAPAPGDAASLKSAARAGAQGALDAFRDKPNRIGRARMFAERSMGLDDPGMVAVLRMTESL